VRRLRVGWNGALFSFVRRDGVTANEFLRQMLLGTSSQAALLSKRRELQTVSVLSVPPNGVLADAETWRSVVAVFCHILSHEPLAVAKYRPSFPTMVTEMCVSCLYP